MAKGFSSYAPVEPDSDDSMIAPGRARVPVPKLATVSGHSSRALRGKVGNHQAGKGMPSGATSAPRNATTAAPRGRGAMATKTDGGKVRGGKVVSPAKGGLQTATVAAARR